MNLWPTYGTLSPIADLEVASRCLFSWDAADGNLVARSGQVGTWYRATAGSVTDRWGHVAECAPGMPRFTTVQPVADVHETALLVESPSTNQCPRSNELDQWPWTPVTVTGVPNARPYGAVSLTRLEDASTTVQGLTHITCAMTAPHATLSAYIEAGEVRAASGTTIRLRDNNANAVRGGVVVTWNASLVPSVAAVSPSVAANVRIERVTATLYRVSVIIPSGIVTGNNNRLEVIPATTTSQTGSVYVGGVQIENLRTVTSVIVTDGGTRNRTYDKAEWPIHPVWHDRFTILLDVLTPPHASYTGAADYQAGITFMGGVRLLQNQNSRQWVAYPSAALVSGTGFQGWTATPSQRVVAQFDGYVRGGRRARLDVGGGFGSWTTPIAGVVPAQPLLVLAGETNNASNLSLQRLLVVQGHVDRDTMETLL